MHIEIKNRWNLKVLFETEAESLKLAVEAAVSQGISLRDADLRAADLRDANLRAADLSDADLRAANLSAANLSAADLSDANLRAANLSDADLRAANLSAANLRAADLRDADLRAADLRDANLSDANLSAADLSDANLSDANLSDAKNDLWNVLLHAPREIAGLKAALQEGRVNGSCYQGECACLVGTIANVRKCSYDEIPGLAPDGSRPAERLFLGIKEGDTAETNKIVNLVLEWIEEFERLLQSATVTG